MLGMHEQGGKFVSVKLKPKQHAQSHVVDSACHSPVHGLGMIGVIVLRTGWMQPFIAFPMVCFLKEYVCAYTGVMQLL